MISASDTVVIIDNGADNIIRYKNDVFGKFLNVGDYIVLHNTRYKVCSKTYEVLSNSKWILIVKEE